MKRIWTLVAALVALLIGGTVMTRTTGSLKAGTLRHESSRNFSLRKCARRSNLFIDHLYSNEERRGSNELFAFVPQTNSQ